MLYNTLHQLTKEVMIMEYIAILFGLFVWCILRLITNAPLGYEDEKGFHFGPEPCETEDKKG